MNFPDDCPIIACSTSTSSNAAIAVLRFSGFSSNEVFDKYLSLSSKKIKNRFAHLVDICDENGQKLDQAIFLCFKAPASFTGENCAELHIHGNLININSLLNLFIKNGDFRMAKEGEFTYRALKNKKLNLSQVEGLDLMLNANSSLMLQKGLDILHGDLYNQYQDLYQKFLKLKMSVEMNVDFAEDMGELEALEMFKKATSDFNKAINFLYSKVQVNTKSLLSPSIVLVGGTNAGKSSLFNALLSESRSIVSPVAGTTRDFISEYVFLEGTNFKLVDTAGIRITKDKIEEEGIKRAYQILENSFFKILVINPFIYEEKDYNLPEVDIDLLIITHSDCAGFNDKIKALKLPITAKSLMFTSVSETGPIGPDKNSGPIGPDGNSGPIGPNGNSGPIGPGGNSGPIGPGENSGPIGPDRNSGPIGPDFNLLNIFTNRGYYSNEHASKAIGSLIVQKYQSILKLDPIPIERHCQVINNIYLDFGKFNQLANNSCDFGILSSELNILDKEVSELIGITPVESVLNEIFSNFCIGK